MLNFFTTLGSRGAQTPQELVNQRAKVIAELSHLNADVYGLSEVQNFANGNTSGGTYTNAARATSRRTSPRRRAAIISSSIRSRRPTSSAATSRRTARTPSAASIIYDAAEGDPRRPRGALLPERHEPAEPGADLQAGGRGEGDSQTFTVVVNHFRSKGSACGGASDDPFQGNCNGLRLLMAQNVQTWLAGNPTGDPAGANRKYLLIGDFNAYSGEDPIQSFLATATPNLIASLIGPEPYSVQLRLAGGLSRSRARQRRVAAARQDRRGAAHQRRRTGRARGAGQQPQEPGGAGGVFAANEFAASDHDPFVVALNPLAGDLNDDGVVDLSDRDVVVSSYGKPASQVDRRVDYDGDGTITPNDYRLWLNFYRTFVSK